MPTGPAGAATLPCPGPTVSRVPLYTCRSHRSLRRGEAERHPFSTKVEGPKKLLVLLSAIKGKECLPPSFSHHSLGLTVTGTLPLAAVKVKVRAAAGQDAVTIFNSRPSSQPQMCYKDSTGKRRPIHPLAQPLPSSLTKTEMPTAGCFFVSF